MVLSVLVFQQNFSFGRTLDSPNIIETSFPSLGEYARSYREEFSVIAPGLCLRILVVMDELNLGQVDTVVVGL